ncbi:glycosyltransferase family 4 protein [Geomesophilobacter sediminis]|uniref:Glycosyltransferase family 4 protein n=1 Tax=Geomesophilobacter sediminis TaxID=2798584 RepID=A0A8J7IMU6_9BACT|nr:glycosyltransferase family 4 protein [Geomesophilobacter sediminis]MBJ6724248.1 glycosyltransferase family 4 protein [Geomesophilobacter sediminis]
MDRTGKILMAGPSREGRGGITKVVNNWLEADYLAGFRLDYLATTAGEGGKLLPAVAAVARAARRLGEYDLLYIHSSSRSSFFRKSLIAWLGRLYGRRMILHIHPNHFLDFLAQARGVKRSYILATMAQFEAVVALNDEVAAVVRRLLPGRQVFVLPNPVDLNRFAAPAPERRDEATFLFLGSLLPAKGIYDLAAAVEILKGRGVRVRVNCFGASDGGAFAAHLARRGLGEISVGSWLGPDEVVRELKRCTALILPSHTEGLPNVVLEAMAARTPVLATSVGGLQDLLRDGENALVFAPADPESLADKIALSLADPALRRTVADRGFRDVAGRYDSAVLKKRFRSILEAVLGGAPC